MADHAMPFHQAPSSSISLSSTMKISSSSTANDLYANRALTGFFGLKVEDQSQARNIGNGGSFGVPGNGDKTGGKKGKKKIRFPRFAFRTTTQVDILDDGYRWRKYGQKAVKNNKFPRSYYRCSHQGCSVKKQVQRQSKDEGVVVTTYEGVHTHAVENPTDNFEQILSQMHIYPPFF